MIVLNVPSTVTVRVGLSASSPVNLKVPLTELAEDAVIVRVPVTDPRGRVTATGAGILGEDGLSRTHSLTHRWNRLHQHRQRFAERPTTRASARVLAQPHDHQVT